MSQVGTGEGQNSALLPIDENRPVEHGFATVVTPTERRRFSLRRLRRALLAARRKCKAEALERRLDELFDQLEQPNLTHIQRSAIVVHVRAILNHITWLSTFDIKRRARLEAACQRGSGGGCSASEYSAKIQHAAWEAVQQVTLEPGYPKTQRPGVMLTARAGQAGDQAGAPNAGTPAQQVPACGAQDAAGQLAKQLNQSVPALQPRQVTAS